MEKNAFHLMPPYTLQYFIHSCTSSTPTGGPQNVLSSSKAAYWTTGSGTNHELVLQLRNPCLVTSVDIDNKGVSELKVDISLTNERNSFVPVLQKSLPLNKKTCLSISNLPAQFIRLLCISGTPISIFQITVRGYIIQNITGNFAKLVCPNPQTPPLYYSTTHGVRDERKDPGKFPNSQCIPKKSRPENATAAFQIGS
jgi:hypothetical protein